MRERRGLVRQVAALRVQRELYDSSWMRNPRCRSRSKGAVSTPPGRCACRRRPTSSTTIGRLWTCCEGYVAPSQRKASRPPASPTKPNPFSGLYHLTVARTGGPGEDACSCPVFVECWRACLITLLLVGPPSHVRRPWAGDSRGRNAAGPGC